MFIINFAMGLVLSKRVSNSKWNLLSIWVPGLGRNINTYNFGHQYFGRLLIKLLFISVIPTAIIIIIGFMMPNSTIMFNAGLVLLNIHVFFFLLPIVPTGFALRKNFDKQGNCL